MNKALIILGAPGSGKSTQRDIIVQKYGLFSISTGDLVRQAAKTDAKVAEIVKQGKLVSDELIEQFLEKEISENEGKNIVFDGYPRNVAQAKTLDKMLESRDFSIRVVLVAVTSDEVFKRLEKRYICDKCGAVSVDSGTCSCGGNLKKREDDNIETIEKRLAVFSENTQPIIGHYLKRGEFSEVNGEGTFDEVTERLFEKLDDYYNYEETEGTVRTVGNENKQIEQAERSDN